MNALHRLAETVGAFAEPGALLAVRGVVTSVAAGQCRLGGVSALARIGQRVRFGERGSGGLGEIVSIDPDGANVWLYQLAAPIGVGDRAELAPAEPLWPTAWR